MNEEIRVTAETIDNKGKRRRITLAPLNKKRLSIEAREVESIIPCGFQAHWGVAKMGRVRVRVAAGAGFGSRWMTFVVEGRAEGRKEYCIQIDDVVKAVIAFHEELYPPRKRRKAA